MSIISECLQQILSARYGRDVRQAIHDGIQQCYYDGKAGEIDLQARQDIETMQNDIQILQSANDITETTETTMQNSNAGRLLVDRIGGESEQGENPSPTNPQEVKKSVVSVLKTHGNNILSMEEVNQNTSGLDVSVKNNVITIKGTTEKATLLYVIGGYSNVEAVSTLGIGTYSLSDGIRLVNYDGTNRTYRSGTFTLSESFGVTGLQVMNPNGSGSFNVGDSFDFSVNAMLNEGSELLPFEPYKESSITLSNPIDLYGSGDVQDVIEGGKVITRFVKLEFTGAENITEATSYFSIPLNKEAINGSALCDIDSLARTTKNYARLQKYGMTLDEFKAYLVSRYESGSPAYIVYRLAEEEVEKLPMADQIALNSLATFEGITYLEFDSEIQPTFKGSYGSSFVGGMALESRQNIEAINNSLSNHSWDFVTEESGIYTEIESGYVATEDCALQVNALTGNTMNSSVAVYINGTLALVRQTKKADCPFYTTDILRLQKGDVVTSKVNDSTNSGASLGLYIRPKAQ